MAGLTLKWKNSYLCEVRHNEIDFIEVPNYNGIVIDPFPNISIFITLLLGGHMEDNYASSTLLDYWGWEEEFSNFFYPEYLYQIDEENYLYDVDLALSEYEDLDSCKKRIHHSLSHIPKSLCEISLAEMEEISKHEKELDNIYIEEAKKMSYGFSIPRVNPTLIRNLKNRNLSIDSKDVLLFYSGGRDSTLSALRLRKQGYRVHFTHFNNGYMLDISNPYDMFKRNFLSQEGYYFPYERSNIDIKFLFQNYFFEWKKEHGNEVVGGELSSETQCLSCRMAMYAAAFRLAKEKKFKVLAEGARISQKFMLEQMPMITRLKALASELDLELLFPVLEVTSDEEEKQELLENGFSSKTWESKCLLGKSAMQKTEQDEQIILEYYDTVLKPKILKYVKKEF